MGGPGCALASTLISWMWCCPDWRSCCAVRRTGPLEIFTRWEWPRWDRIQPLLRLGLPMGLTYLIEITSFTLMSIFITRMGTDTLRGIRSSPTSAPWRT
jgi:MATE family multidrug resistance protein